jgi:hypothetical protein
MLTLIIKGDTEQAYVAAAEHGVIIEVKDTLPGEVCAQVDEHYTIQVTNWFCEESTWEAGKGFPPGTLLHYR